MAARRRGASLFTAGRHSEARRAYEEALSLLPAEGYDTERVAINTQLGVCLVSLGKRREAAERFEAALAISPSHGAARKLLDGQRRALGMHEVSRESLQHAVQASPHDADAYTSLAHHLHREGDNARALAALTDALRISPAGPGRDATYHNAGVLQLAIGRLGEAVNSFETAASLNPSNLAASLMLAVTRARDDEDATEQLRRALASAEAAPADTTAELGAEMRHYVLTSRSLLGASPGAPPSSAPSPLAEALAEGLRTRGYAVYDGALGEATLGLLHAATAELSPAMVSGTTGQPGGPQPAAQRARTDSVVRLAAGRLASLSAPAQGALTALRTLLLGDVYPALVRLRRSNLPPIWPREEWQLACYDEGGYYTPHSDEASGGELSPDGDATEVSLVRMYTVIYYANDPRDRWGDHASGGAMRLWPRGSYEAVILPPVADRIVVFDSALMHEVVPVRLAAAKRCAFTQWFSGVRWQASGHG